MPLNLPGRWLRRRSIASLVVSLALLLPSGAAAAPITWHYTGSVVQSFDENIPVGTAASFWVTVPDPHDNFLAGSPSYPDWVGAYWATMTVHLAGDVYDLTRAVLEVNMDAVFGVAFPGSVLLRQFEWAGPPLLGSPMGPVGCYHMGGGGCMDPVQFGGGDPTSAALPLVPLDTFTFWIRPQPGIWPAVRITGTNPQVIPEPALSLLFGAAVAGVAIRRWRQRRSLT